VSEGTLHRILFACTAAVVLGVIFEGYEHWEDLKKKRWRPLIPKIGFVILALGLAGELLIQPFIDSAENAFRIDARERMANLTKETTEAKERTANLEHENLELRKQLRPRILDSRAFVDALKGKPTATAEFLYHPNDPEAYGLAVQIRRWLGPGVDGDGAGWKVSEVKPMDPEGGDPTIVNAPTEIRYGAWWGLAVAVKTLPENRFEMLTNAPKTPVGSLTNALRLGGIFVPQVNVWPFLPEDTLVIVVGQKMN
jgi:hypothetical protein